MPANTVGLNRRAYRAKRKLEVLRGFSPTEPNKLSLLAEGDNDPTLIQSGMALVLDGGKFRATETADATDVAVNQVFIALHDGNQHDVIAANGKLVGLDCSDTYEVETGYFDDQGVYAEGTLLSIGDGGVFKPAEEGEELIVGVVTKVVYTPALLSPQAAADADNAVLTFATRLSGARTAAVVGP